MKSSWLINRVLQHWPRLQSQLQLVLTMRSHDSHNTQKPVRTSSVSSWRVSRHRGAQCIYQLIVCRRLVQEQPNLLPQAFNLHVNSEAAINT
jgi:hypothetical protein